MKRIFLNVFVFIVFFFLNGGISAQFIVNFDKPILYDSTGINGWVFKTGDGFATIKFKQHDNSASIYVDATKDKLGIWWAFIAKAVSANIDLNRLAMQNYELRIEARIRTSHAPRRVNLHLNTQRTTDYHSHLMEYDIPDTTNWYTISMTTHNFDAQPGDTIRGQLSLMDWGFEKYRVDVDYFKVDVVNIDSVGADLGNPIPYRPAIPFVNTFQNHIPVLQDGMIDLKFTEENFNNWHVNESGSKINLIAVNSTQYIIMRWDLKKFFGKKINSAGLLELTTYSAERVEDNRKDFGMIRVTEILGGDPNWEQEKVTYNRLCENKSLTDVINSQMIIDVDVQDGNGAKNFITISQPVLQRLIDGKTLGIAIRPLGPIHASFYSMENMTDAVTAKLHFNVGSSNKKINQ